MELVLINISLASKAGVVHKTHPNHLRQCFTSSSPNQLWVSDIALAMLYDILVLIEYCFLFYLINLYL
jgi:hypothetical protein